MIRAALIILTALACSSCAGIDREIQPRNPAVKPVLVAEDCVITLFDIGFGTLTFSEIMRAGVPIDSSKQWTGPTQIRTIHSARITDSRVFLFGSYCLKITGEP